MSNDTTEITDPLKALNIASTQIVDVLNTTGVEMAGHLKQLCDYAEALGLNKASMFAVLSRMAADAVEEHTPAASGAKADDIVMVAEDLVTMYSEALRQRPSSRPVISLHTA